MPPSRYKPFNPVQQIPLLIEGNFRPSKKVRRLKALVKVACILTCVTLIGALSVYAINVQLVNHMNNLGKKTRDLNESNKELAVQLNRIRAFKNIETSAARLSHLKPAEEVIELTIPEDKRKAVETVLVRARQGEKPRVYGY